MLEQMNTPNADILMSQNLSGDTQNKPHSSDDITTTLTFRKPLEGTPFYVVGDDISGYAITWGHYRLGALRKTPEDAEDDIYNDMWNINVNLIIAVHHFAQSGVELAKK